MELSGETIIAASASAIWEKLNDPAVLARCIDGVESLTRVDDGDSNGAGARFDGRMNARVGPVRATFTGTVRVTEPDPPRRYVLVGEGKGGVAGFAKGRAEVVLHPADGGTRLAWNVASSVGGKLAQLGSRLIEGTAKAYAATFFERFKTEVEGPVEAAPVPPAPSSAPSDPVVADGVPPLIWGGALVAGVVALLAYLLV